MDTRSSFSNFERPALGCATAKFSDQILAGKILEEVIYKFYILLFPFFSSRYLDLKKPGSRPAAQGPQEKPRQAVVPFASTKDEKEERLI